VTDGRVEWVSPERGSGHVLNRNQLLADLIRTRVNDGHRHVQLRVTLDDGQVCTGWLSRVEVDRQGGTLDLVSEPFAPGE
jgi:hypothetical protein